LGYGAHLLARPYLAAHSTEAFDQADLPMIHELPLLLGVDDLEFLRKLHAAEIFDDEPSVRESRKDSEPTKISLAEQQKVRDYVTDPRLAPIVGAVIDAAFDGNSPGVGELLDLVDVAAQRQVHDALFAGRYRDEENPAEVLDRCLFDCRLESLEQRRNELAARISQAIERGEQPIALTLSRERSELNQQLAALKRLSADLPPSANQPRPPSSPARTH